MKKKQNKICMLKDSRESDPSIYLYNTKAWAEKVIMIRTKLPVGDFSCMGCEHKIVIERKTLSDLCGSMGNNRNRFERMWERADDLKIKHRFLMIEGFFMAGLWAGNYRSEILPQSLLGTLMSWQIRYKYHWFFVPNVRAGAEAVYRILLNYQRIEKKKEK